MKLIAHKTISHESLNCNLQNRWYLPQKIEKPMQHILRKKIKQSLKNLNILKCKGIFFEKKCFDDKVVNSLEDQLKYALTDVNPDFESGVLIAGLRYFSVHKYQSGDVMDKMNQLQDRDKCPNTILFLIVRYITKMHKFLTLF